MAYEGRKSTFLCVIDRLSRSILSNSIYIHSTKKLVYEGRHLVYGRQSRNWRLEMLYGRQSLHVRMTGDVWKASTKVGRETHCDENFLDSDGINW